MCVLYCIHICYTFVFTFVTFLGCIDVDIGPIVYRDLQRAQEHLVLAGDLHLVHLVTPYDLTLSMKLNHWILLFTKVRYGIN